MRASESVEWVDARYALGEMLGAGGMARVYEGKGADGARLAIKLLPPGFTRDQGMIARLGDEARAGMRVRHRNVVKIVDYGFSETGVPFLVMNRVDGTPLGAVLQREGALPLSRIRSIASQVLAGLAAIHRAGLVHGDVKCDNVLVDTIDGVDRVTLIDLGLARSPATHPAYDDEETLLGTPEYMAPELIRGEPITAAADLYAVGVIIYELLTGTTPFGGGTTAMIFERQLQDEVVPPSLRCPDRAISSSLEGVIMRALDKDPDARPLNAELFATALERSLVGAYDDLPRRPRAEHVAVSREAPTCDWPPRKHAIASSHRKCAVITGTRDEDALLEQPRAELRAALADGLPEPIVVAYLALAEALIDARRLREAARELESAVARFERTSPPPSLWRLVLALAAIYDGVGERVHARRVAVEACGRARDVASATGEARSRALLRRLDAAKGRKRKSSRACEA